MHLLIMRHLWKIHHFIFTIISNVIYHLALVFIHWQSMIEFKIIHNDAPGSIVYFQAPERIIHSFQISFELRNGDIQKMQMKKI